MKSETSDPRSAISPDAPSRKAFFFLCGILLVFGTLLRLFHLWEFSALPLLRNPLGPDVAEYYQWARGILFDKLLWTEVPIHAPLYPFFLAFLLKLTGEHLYAVRLIQMLAGLLSLYPLAFVLKQRFARCHDLRRFTPELFLTLLALYPPLIAYQCELFSENAAFPMAALGLACFLYRKDSGSAVPWNIPAAAACFSLAALAHPLSLLPLGLLLLQLLWERRWKRAVCYAAVSACLILPVAVYNSVLEKAPVLIQANSAFNLYQGNNPRANGTCAIAPGPDWDSALAELDQGAAQAQISPDAFARQEVLRFLREKPGDFLRLQGRKLALIFAPDELTTWSDIAPLKLLTIHRFGFHLFLILAIPALALLLAKAGDLRFRAVERTWILVFLGYVAGQMIVMTSGRYRLILLLPLAYFAALFLTTLISALRLRKFPGKLFSGLLAALMLIPAGILLQVRDSELESAMAHTLLAEAYLKTGKPADLDPAEQHLRAAFRRIRNWDHLPNLMGELLLRRGKTKEAMECYHAAATYFPGYSSFLNYAVMLSDEGNDADADTAFSEAKRRAKRAPDRALVLYNIGQSLQRRGLWREAEKNYRESLRLGALNPMALNNLGLILMLHDPTPERLAEAERLLENAFRQDPAPRRKEILRRLREQTETRGKPGI